MNVIITQVHCTVKVNEACRSMLEMSMATGKRFLGLDCDSLAFSKEQFLFRPGL